MRTADASNERGYFEWERIKQLPRKPGLIAECEGKAVKVISSLLMSLPEGPDYRIVFVERDLDVHPVLYFERQRRAVKMRRYMAGLATLSSGLAVN